LLSRVVSTTPWGQPHIRNVSQCPVCHIKGDAFATLDPCQHKCCMKCAPLILDCCICGTKIKERVRVYGM
jgi:hypothetical protein